MPQYDFPHPHRHVGVPAWGNHCGIPVIGGQPSGVASWNHWSIGM